jgi:hypothetical protein
MTVILNHTEIGKREKIIKTVNNLYDLHPLFQGLLNLPNVITYDVRFILPFSRALPSPSPKPKDCRLSFTTIFSQLPSVTLVYNHYLLHDLSKRISIPTPQPNPWEEGKMIAHSPRTMLTDIPSSSRSLTFLEGLSNVAAYETSNERGFFGSYIIIVAHRSWTRIPECAICEATSSRPFD